MMNALLKQRAQKLTKNKKGFTLIEMIVVLVILAILAAIAIPSMMKYVNDAREKTLVAEARSAYTAAQYVATQAFALHADAIVTVGEANVSSSVGIKGTTDKYIAPGAGTKADASIANSWFAKMDAYLDGTLAQSEAHIIVKLKDAATGTGDNEIPAGGIATFTYIKGTKQVVFTPGDANSPVVSDYTETA